MAKAQALHPIDEGFEGPKVVRAFAFDGLGFERKLVAVRPNDQRSGALGQAVGEFAGEARGKPRFEHALERTGAVPFVYPSLGQPSHHLVADFDLEIALAQPFAPKKPIDLSRSDRPDGFGSKGHKRNDMVDAIEEFGAKELLGLGQKVASILFLDRHRLKTRDRA